MESTLIYIIALGVAVLLAVGVGPMGVLVAKTIGVGSTVLVGGKVTCKKCWRFWAASAVGTIITANTSTKKGRTRRINKVPLALQNCESIRLDR